MVLLHFLRWLRKETRLEFEVLLARGGPLESDFAALAPVHHADPLKLSPEFFGRFRMIYSNSWSSAAALAPLPYGDLPIITHVHELDFGIDVPGARCAAQAIGQSNHYIACAKIVADRLQRRFNIPAGRISVHYEMVASEIVKRATGTAPSDVRAACNLPENARIVAACGTFDLRKAPDLFVQLAARVQRLWRSPDPLRFLWIGKINDRVLAVLLEHDLRRLGITGTVQFLGELDDPHRVLALADVFCVTSREDPFPLVMLEAGLLGKPVLCFDGAGGGSEFCALGGGRAAPFLDLPAMAQMCCELLCDADQRTTLGNRAAELVRANFTIEAAAPKLWAELARHLKTPPPMSTFRAEGGGFADIFRSWRLEEAPERSYIEAQFQREDARRDARRLFDQGRVPDAARVLLRAARAAAGASEPFTVVEGLLEIARDLTPIDADKGRYLRVQAEQIARKAGIVLRPVVRSSLSQASNLVRPLPGREPADRCVAGSGQGL